jgi:sulfite reductase (NADPH) hemoprotein beta-component
VTDPERELFIVKAKKEIRPDFKTNEENFSKEEHNKLNSKGYIGEVENDFADLSSEQLNWETEQIAKSHGIYLEYDRDQKGKEKDWIYLIRFATPAGGPLNKDQWHIIDEAADRYTRNTDGIPSIRLTTRQAIQFHWVKKSNVPSALRDIAQARIYGLNGCGDNVRNVTACPMSRFSGIFDATAKAHEIGKYFRLPIEPYFKAFGIDSTLDKTPHLKFKYKENLLNRKFKIALSSVGYDAFSKSYIGDNCVECRTNDIGIAPLVENGKVDRYQIYIGGGQGQKNGKPTLSKLGEPFGIIDDGKLIQGLDAIVSFQQDWGDRQNRHWARLKYIVNQLGAEFIRKTIHDRSGDLFDSPDVDFDPGPRDLHHGWTKQASNGLWTYGLFIENGRIIDRPQCRLKQLIRHLMDTYSLEATITANQDLLLSNLTDDMRATFMADLSRFGYGEKNGEAYSALRRNSVSCVGLPTCRLSYSDSERFLPELIDELEKRGWGNIQESIGLSGCERQCSRPATKTIGWVASGKNRYMLKLMGAEDARLQGHELTDTDGKILFRVVPRDRIADVTEALLEIHREFGQDNESMGYFHQRMGVAEILSKLSAHSKTEDLAK